MYRSKYATPVKKPDQPKIKPLALNDANFPTLSPCVKQKPTRGKPAVAQTPKVTLDFKKVAEASKDLPDPIHIEIIALPTVQEEPAEVYDLTPYVKLQERRQAEYDYLYGEGAFVRDKLNYERFSDPIECSESSEEEPSDDDLMDY